MSRAVEFFVPGEPQGKGRARAYVKKGRDRQPLRNRRGGIAIGHYTPEATRSYEEQIGWLAADARNSAPFNGPVRVALEIRKGIPESWPKWKKAMAIAGQIRPTTKPDIDNVEKAIKDACNGVLWVDDSQVVEDQKISLYVAERPGVRVRVEPLDAYPADLTTRPRLTPASA